MQGFIVDAWNAVMDSRHSPLRHLPLQTRHYLMQVLAWMWSMLFSLSFLSIFHFGYLWLAQLLLLGGVAMTVAVFREAERQRVGALPMQKRFGQASRCVWKLDSEA
jgi:hypothetical protein